MQTSPEKFPQPVAGRGASLELLLFVDKRSGASEQVQRIRQQFEGLQAQYPIDLKIIDVGEQPYLAEHFKLVATPVLIKISPEPRQTLAGKNLLDQVDLWWERWQQELDQRRDMAEGLSANPPPLGYSVELMRLADEVFRLNQENEALREQLRFKDRIIAMLAHDLRNPLTAASIALETLDGNWESQEGEPVNRIEPELLQRLTHHARTQMQVIERMITNLLQAARGSSSELSLQPRKVDLKSLCQEVLADLSSHFESKQQKLQTDIPTDLPLVYADSDRVRQVLINLLENASKYTPEQGLIEVSILHRTTQKIQVSICDNGPGIPLENQERIFEDKFRLQRDEHQEGYGLGLALCRRIIRAHYGQIWVESVPGQGSGFHFTLPVYPK